MKILGINFGNKQKVRPTPTLTKDFEDLNELLPQKEPLAAPVVEDRVEIKSIDVQDKIPELNVTIPGNKQIKDIPRIVNPVLNYASNRMLGRGQFQPAEYNLAEIGRVADVDSYPARAFSKKLSLLFKEGWTFVGKNTKTTKYIRLRMAQIARASGVPTETLLRDIGSAIVTKSNAFLVKARSIKASGGKVRTDPSGKKLLPIAGYFIAPAEAMEFQMKDGKIVSWRQNMPNGDYKEFSPSDVIHIHYNRKEGFVFGTPTITPVIDDIRALRKIEENIELLIYQHLFPIFQWKVGTKDAPASKTETGEDEVDVIRREIQYMPTEGGIVTSERHEITAIGAEGRALSADSYLKHFKQRVFSGLGVSGVDMGEGELNNRNTASVMSVMLIDSVKDIQSVIEVDVKKEIIDELLLESDFPFDPLEEENEVFLQFKEIDIETQIKKESHQADMFTKNIIGINEGRIKIGYDPIEIPSLEERQQGADTAEQYEGWNQLAYKLMTEPKALIQSLDEKWVTQPESIDAAQKTSSSSGNAASSNKPKSTLKIKNLVSDAYLTTRYKEVSKDMQDYFANGNPLDYKWTEKLIQAPLEDASKYFVAEQMISFKKGYDSVGDSKGIEFLYSSVGTRKLFQSRTENFISRLIKDINKGLERNTDSSMSPKELSLKVRDVFETLKFRSNFAEHVELNKAYWYGSIKARQDKGELYFSYKANEDSCEECKAHDGQVVSLKGATFEDTVPFHPNCDCSISSTKISLQDSVFEALQRSLLENRVTFCKKCDKTANKVKYTTDLFYCNNCSSTFSDIEDKKKRSNSAVDENCIRNLAQQLYENENLGLSREEARQVATGMCKAKEGF